MRHFCLTIAAAAIAILALLSPASAQYRRSAALDFVAAGAITGAVVGGIGGAVAGGPIGSLGGAAVGAGIGGTIGYVAGGARSILAEPVGVYGPPRATAAVRRMRPRGATRVVQVRERTCVEGRRGARCFDTMR